MTPWQIVTGILQPVADVINKRQERKQAKDEAQAELVIARQQNRHEITLQDTQLEHILSQKQDTTWKDEYVTVSLVSIVNLLIVGGLEAAYRGEDAFVLEGLAMAIGAMVQAGVDVGFLITAAVLAGLGLSIWKKT